MCLIVISRELAQDDELVFPKSIVKVTSKRRPANQAFGLDLTVREANAMAKPRHLRSLGMVHGTLGHPGLKLNSCLMSWISGLL